MANTVFEKLTRYDPQFLSPKICQILPSCFILRINWSLILSFQITTNEWKILHSRARILPSTLTSFTLDQRESVHARWYRCTCNKSRRGRSVLEIERQRYFSFAQTLLCLPFSFSQPLSGAGIRPFSSHPWRHDVRPSVQRKCKVV